MLNYVLKYENTKISAQNIVRLETKSQYWCTDDSFFINLSSMCGILIGNHMHSQNDTWLLSLCFKTLVLILVLFKLSSSVA